MKKKVLSVVLSVFMALSFVFTLPAQANKTDGTTVVVHYARTDKSYDNWSLWMWADGANGKEYKFTADDSYGKVAIFKSTAVATKVGFIVKKGDWEEKDIDSDRFIEVKDGFAEIWITQGKEAFATSAPAGATAFDLSSVTTTTPTQTPAATDGIKVKIHYHRFDQNYENWNVWAWGEGADGSALTFSGKDDYGAVLEQAVPGSKGVAKIGFIVRKGDWEAKDVAADRFIDTSKLNADGVLEVYLVEGDTNIYYSKDKIDLTPKFMKAQIDSATTISFTVTSPFNSADPNLTSKFTLKDASGNNIPIKVVMSKDSGIVNNAIVITEKALDLNTQYVLTNKDYGSIDVSVGNAFSSDAFKDAFNYDGNDLGATYSQQKTKFRIWAPTAAKVVLNLYKEGSGDNKIKSVDMTKDVKGTWLTEISEDLNKVYYTYSVTVGGATNEAVDPYAKAAGVNGQRGMVIDLGSTNPNGWDKSKRPAFKNFSDAIVYEMHIRDFSIDSSSGITNKGKYLGLTETGTKNSAGLSTGLDHLKELGITHVQIQPFYDYKTVDESKLDTAQFNWGYDPQNYNVPEGSYSSDPTKGEVRVNEAKQMVKALHDNDIRVIMDVVYNHTADSVTSNLNKVVPNYYYRQDASGGFSNGSGCGNEIASDRLMTRKYIVDSVVYWATEYKIDGFRFDLMGLIDIETMNAIREALNKVDPSIIIYGEGWTGGTSALAKSESALKDNTSKLNGIGVFSDDIRDGLKGSVFNAKEQGFISGVAGKEESIKFGVVGGIQHSQLDYTKVNYSKAPWAANPFQSVNYAEAHDNLTLWDKLASSNPDDSVADRTKMDKLAAGIVFTAQGVPFFQLGQDFLRSKPKNSTGTSFDSNSYKSSDAVNSIKWDEKTTNKDVFEYYKGLISFRNAHPALRMMNAGDVQNNLVFMDNLGDSMVGYTINNSANKDPNQKILVVYNGNKASKDITLPEGTWDMYVNATTAGTNVIKQCSGTVSVDGISMIVLTQGKTPFVMSNFMLIIIIVAAVVVVLAIAFVVILLIRKKKKTAYSINAE